MDDETRERVREAAEAAWEDTPNFTRMQRTTAAIVAGVEAALDACEERERKPAPDSGGEVELPGDEDAERLKREVDHLRTQLAGCGVAADGGTSGAMVAQCGDFGWSASYQAVLDCRRELDQLRDRLSEAATALGCEPSEAPRRVRVMHDEIDYLSEHVKTAERERDEAREEIREMQERFRAEAKEKHRSRCVRCGEYATKRYGHYFQCDDCDVLDVERAVGAHRPTPDKAAQTWSFQVVHLQNECDEARADANQLHQELEASKQWQDTYRNENARLHSELRQARKLAPETVALLSIAQFTAAPAKNLVNAAHRWRSANCPDLPKGGE